MQATVLILIVFKFVHLASAGVFMDEAYYWMWGQHPALSYYDHPPLDAWTLWLSSQIFGWNVVALRAPVALSLIADIGALYLLSRRIGGDGWATYFWVTLLLFLTIPIYWMVTAVALPDHLLLTFCLFALSFLVRFFADREEGRSGDSRDLYGAAICLGFAGLSKYNAAFLALAVAIYVVLRHRALFAEIRLYVAGAITLVMQLPVIVWNFSEGFASWSFILHGRHAGLRTSLDGLFPFAFGILLFVGPIVLWAIARFAFESRKDVPALGLARTTFWLSTLAILTVALTTEVLFHWNLVAYIAMLPYLAIFFRPRWLLLIEAMFGIAAAVAIFVNYSVTPLTQINAWRDEATAWSYGWDSIAAAVQEARAQNPAGFTAAADYTTASLLGFALKDKDVVSLSPRRDQYDYWFDANAHAGQDAILLGDRWRPLPKAVKRQFASVSPLTTVTVTRGLTLNKVTIYLAKGFKPNG